MFFRRNVKWGPRGVAVTPFPTPPCGKERSARRAKPAPSRHVTPRHATARPGHASNFSGVPAPAAASDGDGPFGIRPRQYRSDGGQAAHLRAGAPGLKRDAPAAGEYGRSWGAKRTAGRAATCPGATAASRHVTQRSRPDQIRTDQNKERIYSASAAPLRRIPVPRSGRMGAFLFPS